ncbi:hypothetical protein D9615_010146 [Tricholomella constricta]|uniref:Uncharacterized protein n=1 Tax=Tricholomella constricta TaxID=117010 RepID=A0A8H5LTQ9_9AGAR|nr:hypothetical protein D9615_010146 [Tricholomella constricta]
MSVFEVEVVRVRGPSTQSQSSYGKFTVPGPPPLTPKRARDVVMSGVVPYSSSPGNYDFELDHPTTPGLIEIAHSKTDRQRNAEKARRLEKAQGDTELLRQELEGVKEKVKRVEDLEEKVKRLEDMEEKVKRMEDLQATERLKDQEVVAAWETCDRMARAINDIVKFAVFTSPDSDDIQDAQYAWSEATTGTKYRYRMYSSLPHLLTAWWLETSGEDFELPDYLVPLTLNGFHWTPLSPQLARAAECLWDHYKTHLDVMLRLFWERPSTQRNNIQHLAPTMAFARSYLTTILSEKAINSVSPIIALGTRFEGTQKVRSRKEEDEVEGEAMDENLRLCDLLGLIQTGNTGLYSYSMQDEATEGKKRPEDWSEDDDDDRTSKRLKHDTSHYLV